MKKEYFYIFQIHLEQTNKVMKIAIFGTVFSENFNKYIQHLVKKLESEKIDIIIEESFYLFLSVMLSLLFYLLVSYWIKAFKMSDIKLKY